MSTLEASSASFPLKDTRIFHRESTWSFAAVLETASTILHPLVMIVLEVVPAGLLLALIVPMVACFVLAAIILLAVFAVLRLTHHLLGSTPQLMRRLGAWSCDLLAQLLSEVFMSEGQTTMPQRRTANDQIETTISLMLQFVQTISSSIGHTLEAVTAKRAHTATPHVARCITNDEDIQSPLLSPSLSQNSSPSAVEVEDYDSGSSSSSSPCVATLDLPHGRFSSERLNQPSCTNIVR